MSDRAVSAIVQRADVLSGAIAARARNGAIAAANGSSAVSDASVTSPASRSLVEVPVAPGAATRILGVAHRAIAVSAPNSVRAVKGVVATREGGMIVARTATSGATVARDARVRTTSSEHRARHTRVASGPSGVSVSNTRGAARVASGARAAGVPEAANEHHAIQRRVD